MGHIMRRHVIPNVAPSLIVLSTSWIGIAALWIAGLGFLGLGVQPPSPEWGAILNEGASYITIAWWITVFPGTILALYVVGMNLVGDGLRDQLDPTVSRR
jgi:ABC-type dipeptide/oligopeptide/nickel transport system permease subunit